jgi:hypothetical protein
MSPDGKVVASSYFFSPKGSANDAAVILWDVAKRKELRRIDVGSDYCRSLAFSPDGKNLVWQRTYQSEFHVVDVASGAELRVVQSESDKVVPSFGLRFSPVDPIAALELADGTFRIWDVVTGSQVRSMAANDTKWVEHYDGRFSGVQRLAFSPDGKYVAVAGQRDNSIALLEVVSGKERVRLRGHKEHAEPVAFSPDGKTLYSGSADATLLAWDLQLDIKPKSEKLGKRELESLRNDLTSADAVEAYTAIRTLEAYPEQAAAMLRDYVKPVAPIEQKVLDGLLADLGRDDFAKRKAAMTELEKLGELAAPALKRLLASKPKAELSQRVQEILKKADVQVPEVSIIQTVRAIEVLEYLDTPLAREVLEKLAAGAEGAMITRQAKTGLEYMARRKGSGEGDNR